MATLNLLDVAPFVHPADCDCRDCDDRQAAELAEVLGLGDPRPPFSPELLAEAGRRSDAIRLDAPAEAFETFFERLLLAAERAGWEGSDLPEVEGFSEAQAEGLLEAWADGRRCRERDEADLALERGGEAR